MTSSLPANSAARSSGTLWPTTSPSSFLRIMDMVLGTLNEWSVKTTAIVSCSRQSLRPELSTGVPKDDITDDSSSTILSMRTRGATTARKAPRCDDSHPMKLAVSMHGDGSRRYEPFCPHRSGRPEEEASN